MKAFCQRSSCNRRKSLSTLLVFALCLVFSTPLRGALVVATSEVYKDTVKDLGPVVRHRYEATDDNAGSPHIHHRLFVGGKLREYSSYAECGANVNGSVAQTCSQAWTTGFHVVKICTKYNPSCCWYKGIPEPAHLPNGPDYATFTIENSYCLESNESPHCGSY